MKKFSFANWLLTAVVVFAAAMLLRSFGPFAREDSLSHRSIVALGTAVVTATLVTLFWPDKAETPAGPRVKALECQR